MKNALITPRLTPLPFLVSVLHNIPIDWFMIFLALGLLHIKSQWPVCTSTVYRQ